MIPTFHSNSILYSLLSCLEGNCGCDAMDIGCSLLRCFHRRIITHPGTEHSAGCSYSCLDGTYVNTIRSVGQLWQLMHNRNHLPSARCLHLSNTDRRYEPGPTGGLITSTRRWDLSSGQWSSDRQRLGRLKDGLPLHLPRRLRSNLSWSQPCKPSYLQR